MKKFFLIIFLILFNFSLEAYENKKISLENFSIHQYEVTIFEFQKYSETNNIITEAEKTGGGYEWGAGWVKRKGWNYKTPYGKKPDSIYEPAVHISRFEAEAYCKSIEGRLPTFEEWSKAAYQQLVDSKIYNQGKVYNYPSGDVGEKMNVQGLLNFDKHKDVTVLPEGINGLVAMGGNVWEWMDDKESNNSLTAGGSWWYGKEKTKKEGAQYKPSNFYAIYVGFRCAFDN
jgi:formylglycine-generating enzyme required for sulfatase activity